MSRSDFMKLGLGPILSMEMASLYERGDQHLRDLPSFIFSYFVQHAAISKMQSGASSDINRLTFTNEEYLKVMQKVFECGADLGATAPCTGPELMLLSYSDGNRTMDEVWTEIRSGVEQRVSDFRRKRGGEPRSLAEILKFAVEDESSRLSPQSQRQGKSEDRGSIPLLVLGRNAGPAFNEGLAYGKCHRHLYDRALKDWDDELKKLSSVVNMPLNSSSDRQRDHIRICVIWAKLCQPQLLSLIQE